METKTKRQFLVVLCFSNPTYALHLIINCSSHCSVWNQQENDDDAEDSNRADRKNALRLEGCYSLESPIGNTRPERERDTCRVLVGPCRSFLASSSSSPRIHVFVQPPQPHQLSHSLTFQWARVCRRYMYRRHAALFAMAYASTLGGGWASVRNPQRSFYWALRLYEAAKEVGDEASMRKCRVFVGYHQLWDGRKGPARSIFRKQLDDAYASRDVVHIARCTSALFHEAHNPLYNNGNNNNNAASSR